MRSLCSEYLPFQWKPYDAWFKSSTIQNMVKRVDRISRIQTDCVWVAYVTIDYLDICIENSKNSFIHDSFNKRTISNFVHLFQPVVNMFLCPHYLANPLLDIKVIISISSIFLAHKNSYLFLGKFFHAWKTYDYLVKHNGAKIIKKNRLTHNARSVAPYI